MAEGASRADGEPGAGPEPLAERAEVRHGDGAAVLQRWDREPRCLGLSSQSNTTLPLFILFCPRVPEVNPRRPPLAYLISEGSEPLTFTNVFPHWERSPEANTQVQTAEFQINIYPALVTR